MLGVRACSPGTSKNQIVIAGIDLGLRTGVSRSRSTSLALAFAVIAGCASAPPPRKPGEEYLEAIKFEGNKKLKDKDLLTGLGLHRTQNAAAHRTRIWSVDADRIRGRYLREGYLEADVHSRVERQGDRPSSTRSTRARARRRSSRSAACPTIRSSPTRCARRCRSRTASRSTTSRTTRRRAAARRGPGRRLRARQARREGRSSTREPHRGRARSRTTPGPKCTFGKIEIRGVDGPISRTRCAPASQFTTGQQFSAAAIAATQRDLYGMRRFSTVRVQPARTTAIPSIVDVVAVAGRRAHELKLGGGFGIDPRATRCAAASVTRYRLAVRRSIRDLDCGPRTRSSATAAARSPASARSRPLDAQDSSSLRQRARRGRLRLPSSRRRPSTARARGSAIELADLHRPPQAARRLVIQRFAFTHLSPLIDPALRMQHRADQTELNGAFQQSLKLDYRDIRSSRSSASTARSRCPKAPPTRAATSPTPRSFPSCAVTCRSGHRSSWRRARATARSSATCRSASGTSPVARLAARVLRAPALAVRQRHDDGRHLGAERRRRDDRHRASRSRPDRDSCMEMPVGGVVFLDAGDVTMTPAELDFGNLNWAVGAGLRAFTIVGAVRFDVGYRLNRNGPTDAGPGSQLRVPPEPRGGVLMRPSRVIITTPGRARLPRLAPRAAVDRPDL